MSTKYGPRYPKIVEINSSIEKFEGEIFAEIQHIMARTKEELDRTAALEKHIQQIEGTQQAAAVPLNGDTASYNILQFEAESDQEIYDILLKQAKEIDLTGNMEKHNIRIVDEARIPRRPVKPNVLLNFLLSVVMGLAFGIGFAFFIDYMDKTIKTPENIMQDLGMSVIGLLPYDKSLKGNKPLLSLNESPDKKKKLLKGYPQYNISSSNIAGLPMIRSEMFGQTLLIESSTAGEGKTTVLAKSAITLARGGLRVVMIDADLHKPSLHLKFGLNNGAAKSGLLNAMTRILSKKIRKGTLEEYSVDDLFFLIALKRQSGRLIITNDTQTMTATFENGRLFHIQQSQDVSFENRLGTMLLRGGFITESQLKDALERNQRTGQPLGYILINAGYINQDRLQGPLKLQMEENLQKLFSWKQGTFVFESGKVETNIDKKIYFQEDYTSTINRLGRIAGSRFLESEILSQVKSLNGSNLSLLPAGIGHTRPEGPLNYALFARFLDILKQHFDVVLIDAPPLLETMGETRPLLPLVDGVVLVIKSGHVSVKLVKEATTYLKEAKTKIIGTILNQAKIDNSYYGY
jgi:Mrp family chromosome partitioning ATPase